MGTTDKTPKFPKEIRINEFNLLVVDKSAWEVGDKIAINYLDAKIRIRHALASGKTVLFLPGTYDLLHAGHIIWFQQAVEQFMLRLKIDRKDVFTVAPFDNDILTRIKKSHRHMSQGGTELYLRPIINERNRAVALANLPYVDLVMPIPSPLDGQDLIPSTVQFDMKEAIIMLNKFESQNKLDSKQKRDLKSVLGRYTKMIDPAHFDDMRVAFTSRGFLSAKPKEIYKKIGIDNTLWNNAAWQLMCFLYKMDKEFFEKFNMGSQKVYRMISKHDGYFPEVKFLMFVAGIKTLAIAEDFITNTTKIIEDNNTRDKMDILIASTDPHNYRFG